MFRFASICGLVVLASSTSSTLGWVPSSMMTTSTRRSISSMAAPTSRSVLFSSVEEEVAPSAEAEAEVKSFSEDYQKAYDAGKAKLTSKMGAESPLLSPLLHFVKEYIAAAQTSSEKYGPDEINNPLAAAGRILGAIGYAQKFGLPNSPDRYVFDKASHIALRGKDPEAENGNTVDYYAFGCDLFRPCMDLEKSLVNNKENLENAIEQMKKGENVVFLANHQSEADPQVVSAMLEKSGYTEAAEEMVFVAGHKVTTDPLAVPFSMGRNLICIHSKKHIDADPETKPTKQRQNLQAMGDMLSKFKQGGCMLWVAPSGGRDRRDVETGEVPVAPFDSKTIDIFRLMGNKSKVPTHFYSMAMVSYDLCPPPDYVAAGVGEERNVRFVPVGIAISEELESVGGAEGRKAFCEDAMKRCSDDYAILMKSLEF